MAQDSNYLATSIYLAATATAPGAGTALVNIVSGSIPKGWYRLVVKVGFGAVVDPTAANINNFALGRGGSALFSNLVAPLLANSLNEHVFERVYFDGSQNCYIANINASGAGGVYNASLNMTPVQ